MSDGVPPRHPEAQTMAAFVDGTLSPGEVATVAEHLRGCGECRTVVSETARFTAEEDVSPASARTWWMYIAAAIVVAIAAVPLFLMRSRSPIDRLIASAPRKHRLVEARLSGFPWARHQAPSRGEAKPDPADLKFTGAAGDVLDVTADRRDAASGHAKGVAYLVIGRRNDSITALERAANGSNDAKAWNDLAAARYASATEDEHPSQLPEALADADHALRLDPRFAEARFNRAIILEHLGILAAARKAWNDYLDLDPNSEWSAEARSHLHKLSGISHRFDPKMIETMPAEQLVREFPEEARRYGEAVLLPDHIDRARAIGEALGAFNGEQLLRDAVGALEGASRESQKRLFEAYGIFRDARINYQSRNAGAAEPLFRHAADLFRESRNPMADVAAYYAASATFDQHLTGARQELQQLLGAVDADRHPALAAEIEWEIAVSANADGDWGSAVRNADDAVAKLRRLGERRSAAFVDSVSAIAYEMMGDRDLAWNRRIHSFEALSQIGAHQQLNTVLHLATITLRPLEQRPAAVALSDLIAEDAQKDPYVFTEVLAERAQNALQAADSRSARVFLEQGRRLLPKITDSSLRESAKAQVNLADARLATVRDPHRALAILNESIPLLASGRLSRFLPEAYLQRGRAYRQLGNQDAALMDCNLAMEQIEKQDASIRDPESHLNFLDTAAQIVDETIDLQLSRGAIADAFSTADRSRTLNDPLAIRPDRIAVPPRGMAVIEYVVRPRALTIFCVAQGVISAETVRIEPRELALDLEAFAEGIRNRVPMDEVRGRGAILYRRLIAPVRPQLAGIKEIVFVPDQQLYAIPFAALWDEHENRYLVEQYVIRFAPAARVHSGEEKTISPALVIADPPALHSPPLLASRDEASRIATLHGAVLLTGDAATRASFEKLAPSSALIHFAGHANSDAGESYGALLFAPGNGDSGVLSSGEIARLSLTRHPLVVLAACGTFRGNSAHVAGMSSLARSFLIAGARGVVGTLWEIDDDVSAPLFTQFHEQLRTGEPPAQALKAIQIAAIHSRDSRTAHPATWSPIELLGYQ